MADMNAKQTDRGMVVTIGDVLFDTNRSELKAGGLRSVEKLSGFLKAYPKRSAIVEGFTDSTGSDATNQTLATRRAEAVQTALVSMGVARERVAPVVFGVGEIGQGAERGGEVRGGLIGAADGVEDVGEVVVGESEVGTEAKGGFVARDGAK